LFLRKRIFLQPQMEHKIKHLSMSNFFCKAFLTHLFVSGRLFRRGVFCDVHNMRFAREYLQRAARQGHAEAVERMKELRSCAFCGAADAPWKCGFCHQAMYCDYATCCVKHWREGGGVGGGIVMDAGARHTKVCPRTHAAPDDESDDEDGGGEN
jgi:hypothetical protein